MVQISKRHLNAWQKFNEDLQAFIRETEPTDGYATLYEDANTTRNVKGFFLSANGRLDWYEDGDNETWYFMDEDEAREWLSFWRANLRRAKRYWEMDAVELDRLQDGETEDVNDDVNEL